MSVELEEQLFLIRSGFLREIPHPKLIKRAMEKVIALQPGLVMPLLAHILPAQGDLGTALQHHTDEVLKVKLQISNGETPGQLLEALATLYRLHVGLLKKLASLAPQTTGPADADIKLSDPVNSYEILRFVEAANLRENEIKAYICNSVMNQPPAQFDVLVMACLRSKKIVGE